MPQRRFRQRELDFAIHVDPSCMTGPEEETTLSPNAQDTDFMALHQEAGNEWIQDPVVDHWNESIEKTDSDDTTTPTDGEALAVDIDAGESFIQSGDEGEEIDPIVSHSPRESAVSSASRDSHSRESLQSITSDDYHQHSATYSPRQSYGEESVGGHSDVSAGSEQSAGGDEGDASSHHELEDDVFSEDSPRSSMGSTSEAEQHKKTSSEEQRTKSPRISGFSQYEVDEDFVPTVRGTPRPPFRSPSSVKAMQMSSPPPSTTGASPRSRRATRQTLSRLGSPSVSTQYSPKKTPPRFKRNTPPLVLLHATLLPLRWGWGDVLDNAQSSDLTQEGKVLREAWRELHDRVGDTVSDRGILLPHPQNDFEVLEERLLEALELPLRRRARILECGHYLGPANEMTLMEDLDSDEDEEDFEEARSPRPSADKATHWCGTCQCEIKYDALGPGKLFRVKVYASNGLMRAGAWDACWKEMERVDVELEPIVDHRMLEELGQIAAQQERAMEMQEAEELLAQTGVREEEVHEEPSFVASEQHQHQVLHSSPQPEIHLDSSPVFEDRLRRDEERLREIYGETPLPQTEPTSEKPRTSDFTAQETPPSPSVEAFERRQERRQADRNASLPTLVFEAIRVLMQDRKNAVIAVLGLLLMAFATRGGGPHSVENDIPPAQAVFEKAPTSNGSKSSSVDSGPTSGDQRYAACSAALDEAQATIVQLQVAASQAPEISTETMIEMVTETMTQTVAETVTIEVTASATPSSPVESLDVDNSADDDGLDAAADDDEAEMDKDEL